MLHTYWRIQFVKNYLTEVLKMYFVGITEWDFRMYDPLSKRIIEENLQKFSIAIRTYALILNKKKSQISQNSISLFSYIIAYEKFNRTLKNWNLTYYATIHRSSKRILKFFDKIWHLIKIAQFSIYRFYF